MADPMKSLRDRIAAAALNAYAGTDTAWALSEGDVRRKDWLEIADAVIRELANTHVSRQSMLTEIQSYAEDAGDQQLLRTAEELIDTASAWDKLRLTAPAAEQDHR